MNPGGQETVRAAAADVLAGYRQWLRREITETEDITEEWSEWAIRLAAGLSALTEDPGLTAGGIRRSEDPWRRGGPAPEPGDPAPVTYARVSAAYPGTGAARARFEDLTMQDAVARASAELKSRGDFDPARHAEEESLNTSEHLEVLALSELLARYYRHPARVHHAVQAGATWAQIAAATATSEPAARQAYRDWAYLQHSLWQHDGGRLGLNDAEYADTVRRAAEPDPEAGQ